MPDDRLDDEERDVFFAESRVESVEVAEWNAREAADRAGWNRSENAGSPDAESAPSVSPWKPRSTETTRVRPVAARPILIAASIASVPELEKKTRPSLAGARPSSSSARIAPSALTPSPELPRRTELERLLERSLHPRVVAPDIEHPEPAQPVEVAVAVPVVQVRAFRARPAAVEADRAQHPHELRVDGACVELELVARVALEQLPDAELAHGLSVLQ